MRAGDLTVEVGQDAGGVIVIICEGELDAATVAELTTAVAWSLTADLRRLRIDATKLTFCDSAGLRCLLDAALQCQHLGARLDEVPRDRTVVAVCRSGSRSDRAAKGLRASGYAAENLEGGVTAWTRAGLPLVDNAGRAGRVI